MAMKGTIELIESAVNQSMVKQFCSDDSLTSKFVSRHWLSLDCRLEVKHSP